MTSLEISLGVWIVLKGHCGGNNLVFLFIILKVESFWPFQNLIIISKNIYIFFRKRNFDMVYYLKMFKKIWNYKNYF